MVGNCRHGGRLAIRLCKFSANGLRAEKSKKTNTSKRRLQFSRVDRISEHAAAEKDRYFQSIFLTAYAFAPPGAFTSTEVPLL